MLGLAKGYRGRGSTAYRIAIEKVEKALRYAYRDRRNRKRDFRGLWIQRINAGAREHGLTYSQFMHGIKLAGVDLDRKVLSDLAIREPEAFAAIVAQAKAALDAAPQPRGGIGNASAAPHSTFRRLRRTDAARPRRSHGSGIPTRPASPKQTRFSRASARLRPR